MTSSETLQRLVFSKPEREPGEDFVNYHLEIVVFWNVAFHPLESRQCISIRQRWCRLGYRALGTHCPCVPCGWWSSRSWLYGSPPFNCKHASQSHCFWSSVTHNTTQEVGRLGVMRPLAYLHAPGLCVPLVGCELVCHRSGLTSTGFRAFAAFCLGTCCCITLYSLQHSQQFCHNIWLKI